MIDLPRHVHTVIVGAGSAGAVLAARLSEDPARSVLLLEAGPDHPTSLPDDLRDGTKNSLVDHDWGYRYRTARGGLELDFPRGKVVGGSSAVNTCIALRGQPYDYDEWAALGLPEWSFERCLPAFRALEHDLDHGGPYHGKSGPIPIRRHRPEELTPYQSAFLEACDELGFSRCDDHNDPTTTGHGPHAMNKVDGERMSAARCYLDAATRARPNLHILASAEVTALRFEAERVTGVEVAVGDRLLSIDAELVVLSAGAIGTPLILLRSGIGPAAQLAEHGVRVRVDAPGVARRLLDHPGTAMLLLPREGLVRTSDPMLQTSLRYRSEGSRRPNDTPLQPGGVLQTPHGVLPLVTLMSHVGKPRGAGTLRFPSLALGAKPQIDSRCLDDPDDLECAVESMELMTLLASSRALRGLVRPLSPSPRKTYSRRALRDAVRAQRGSGYHPSGTAPMGPDSDPNAVTDQYGRVRGVSGLVIADASLMPTIPSANTNLSVLMIGERVASFLRGAVLPPFRPKSG